MLNNILATFYQRDINKLIEEINFFKNETDLWKTQGDIKNSAGNLVLHIIGGMNYLIGTILAQNGYVRNRNEEFSKKNIARKELIIELQNLSLLINKTLAELDMEAIYPIPFDDMQTSNSYVLTQLALHLNYHLGQVNYLRRILV